jgi:HNH endonuclease
MTKLLPPVTAPWSETFTRRHTPPPSGYEHYRSCLRWEFGFSCAFCLLHESDIVHGGAEGWGVTQIEHFVPKSHDPDRRNDYSNLFYICGRCNRARGTQGKGPKGEILLNPCDNIWAQHFKIIRDEIYPRNEHDEHAAHTRDAYKLNDESKVALRSVRRKTVIPCKSLLGRWSGINEKLLDLAVEKRAAETVELAKDLAAMSRLIRLNLHRYTAIPIKHDVSCHCGDPNLCTLPKVLDEQTFTAPEI